MAKTFVGSRVRQLRGERGFSQAALAQMLDISPSYLNQIEHDVRPLTVAVLLRITEVFGVDATFFASQDDTRLLAELREVTLDHDLGVEVDQSELADVVSSHPALARALVNLHRRYRLTTTQLAAATEDRFSDGSGSGSITMPHEEVRDYFYERQNYLHELDTAAEELTVRMRMHRADLVRDLSDRLTSVHDVRIKRIDLGDNVLHRFDPETRTLEIGGHLPSGQYAFKLAAELAYLEYGALIDGLVAEGSFTSDESRKLARLGLANYFAAATVLPYRQFHEIAENFRYDVERLSAFYAVSYETIAHRLSTLQRPSMRGVPLSFVRVDRAGNMSKRQSATGFHFSSAGGTCPLWNVYETFANPGKILVQIAQMPDGRNYMWVARTIERRASRYGQPGKTFAIGLGCELRHAHRLVYSEGLDLSGDIATPIGAGCRVCERDNCPQRAFPALGRALDLDEHRSTVSPYSGEARMTDQIGRIPAGGFRELGPDQLGFGEVGARTMRAPKMHLFATLGQHKRLFLSMMPYSAVLLRGRLPHRRHRAGDPAGRAPARFGVRAAAPPLDGTPSRTRRPDAGADLRLAERDRRAPAGSPIASRRCCVPPTSSSSTARSAPRCGSSCPITSIDVSSSNSACWQGNTTVWRQRCRPCRFRWTTRAITGRCRPARTATAGPAAPATRTRTPPG